MDSLRKVICFVFVFVLLGMAHNAVAQQTDTLCARQLPWETSFEANEGSLQCWQVVDECLGYPTVMQNYAASGELSLAMTSVDVQQICMIATPQLNHRADSLHVTFHLTMAAGSGTLQVGVWDDSVFTPMLTIVNAGDAELGRYEFYTDGLARADSLRVAFRVENCRVCIDDVEVEAATLCRRPCQAWVDEVDVYGVTIGWSSCGGLVQSYILRWTDMSTGITLETFADDSPFALGGLNSGTTYYFELSALCFGGDTTDWYPIGLVTTEPACRQPAEAAVGALGATAVGLRWSYDDAGLVDATGIAVGLEDLNTGAVQSFNLSGTYLFVDSLATGHRYEATLRAICYVDTSAPITLTFIPMGTACIEEEGNTVSHSFPIDAGSPYSYSQMLYPASMLAGMDSIYALSFNVKGTPMVYSPRIVDIYIGQTDSSTLGTNISTVQSQKVVDGMSVKPTEEGWMMMPLDFPVAINQQRNLLITIVDRTGVAGGQLRFGTNYGAIMGNTLYGTTTVMPFDPAVPGLPLTSTTALPDIQLYGDCTHNQCQPPAAMVTAATATSITVGWAGVAGSCMVRYRASGSEEWHITPSATATCTLSGLNPATRYELNVGRVCGTDTVYGDGFDGMTLCGVVSVPYENDFTQGANPCWQGLQNSYGGGVVLGGMIVSPEIGQAANTLQVTLLTAGYGELYLGVCDAGGENIQWVDTLDVYLGSQIVYLDGYTGTSRRIALAGNSNSVQILDVLIEQLDNCLPPRNFAVTAVGGGSATLAWRGTASHYEVNLTEVGSGRWNTMQTTSTQMTIGGLAGNTEYEGWVNAICGGDTSVAVPFGFTTTCGAIAYFPYRESFENQEAPAQCWNLVYADHANAVANPMIHTTEQASEGRRSFRFSSYNYIQSDIYDQYLVSPRIAADDSIWLEFSYRKENIEAEPFAVGFSTSGNNLADFLWFATEQAVAGQWMQYRVGLPAATRYVAIHYFGQNSYHLFIDDLRITGPGCDVPVITMVDEQSEVVSIGWTATGETSYVAITDGIWLSNIEGVEVDGTEYTFGALEQGRHYTVGVRSRCPDGHLSDWTTQQVTTISNTCTPPVGLVASNVGYTDATLGWQPVGDAHRWQLALLTDGVLIELMQPVDVSSVVIDGLEQGRGYSVIVRSLCGDIPGPWSDTLEFTTLVCTTVSNAEYERIDFRTVALSWQEAPVSTGLHRVEYGISGFTPGTGIVVESSDMPLIIGNLEPEPSYDFYIRNYCQPGVLSDSAEFVAVPSGLGIDGVDATGLQIYPNPATSQVSISGIAPGATVEVLDMAGRVVAKAFAQTDNQATTLDVNEYPAGTYFVRVVNSVHIAVGKFVVY